MVTTVTSYTDSRNRANVGEGYDGVVRVSVAGYYGTGALIEGGRAVLTAAHLFKGNDSATVHFETVSGSQSVASGQVFVNPNYDAVNGNHDLAVVWLSASAPVMAEPYVLSRSTGSFLLIDPQSGANLAAGMSRGDLAFSDAAAVPVGPAPDWSI